MNRALIRISALLVSLVCVGCSSPAPGDVRGDMRDAYGAARKLFYYVWAAPDGFSQDNHHEEIKQLLERLSSDFHKVETSAGPLTNDPGFRVALYTNQRLLADAKERFESQKKDYSLWRLRSLTNNCIACHSRYAVPADFAGSAPPIAGESFESQFARAQFLLATRQFEAAGTEFFTLAEAAKVSDSDAFRALQLWLVSEVRVKTRGVAASTQLQGLLTKRNFGPEYRLAIDAWVKDLRGSEPRSLAAVRKTLSQGNAEDLNIGELNRRLVPTLRASSFLHQLLVGTPPENERREATYLLALAYSKMPIASFEVFRELYLEQCIREFPGTKEAQQAFVVLDNIVQQENTGSAGLNLDDQQQTQLAELRALAFGTASDAAKKENLPTT